MDLKEWQCIDAGSEYCPCYLAEENDCITCTQLQGKTYCDCNWMGVCIYNDFYFLDHKKKDARLPQEFPVLESKIIDNNLVLSIKVTKYLSRVLKQPGAYIFIRNKYSEHFFDVPISIMNSDEEKSIITVVIEVRGVKTRKLLNDTKTITVRAPYWNGIYGLNHLKTTKNQKCLILARGVAQAPAVLVVKQLLKNNNTVDVIVNKRTNEHNFINDYFKLDSTKEVDMESYTEVAALCTELVKENKYDLVFIGGSDLLQEVVTKNINEVGNVKFIRTNNNVLCCGEGICGACAVQNEDGIWIKTCKAQIVD